MSQYEPTNTEIVSAAMAVAEIEVDDPDYLATLNIDCLSCLMDALTTERISQGQYDAIWQMFADIDKQGRMTCPQCGGVAYVSMYDPDVAHCPNCGAYIGRSSDDTWSRYAQGITPERKALR